MLATDRLVNGIFDRQSATGTGIPAGRVRVGYKISVPADPYSLRHVSTNLLIISNCVEDVSVFQDFLTLATCVTLTS